MNKALCLAQKIEPLNSAKGHEPARRLWEQAIGRSMSLPEALRICRDCHELGPFTFNNGNTFAAVGRTLVEEHLKAVPPVEAQILRTTICHYIVGLIDLKELQQVLRHFEPQLNADRPAARPAAEPPSMIADPQAQRAASA